MSSPAAPRRVGVLLVGGGVAAARCARALRRGGYAEPIALVGDEARAPYNRPPLSKELLRDGQADELIAAEPEGWYERRGVELITGLPVTAIDAQARVAALADGRRLAFDAALLATGAEPRGLGVPGGTEALLLRTVDDARRIREQALSAGANAEAVVVGGGFIGVEVAASLAELGLRVTLLEATTALWAGTLGETVADWSRRQLEGLGVKVRTGAAVTGLEPGAVLVGGERLPAALVVAGIGVQPRTALGVAAGLRVDDGVLVDSAWRAAPAIFAAGDVARVPHPLAGGAAIRVEHWHAAREGGEAVARAILGEAATLPRAPWVYTEFAGQLVDVLGWLPGRPDDEVVLGDPGRGRFTVARLAGDTVAQLIIVNGHLPSDQARSLVERAPSVREVEELLAG